MRRAFRSGIRRASAARPAPPTVLTRANFGSERYAATFQLPGSGCFQPGETSRVCRWPTRAVRAHFGWTTSAGSPRSPSKLDDLHTCASSPARSCGTAVPASTRRALAITAVLAASAASTGAAAVPPVYLSDPGHLLPDPGAGLAAGDTNYLDELGRNNRSRGSHLGEMLVRALSRQEFGKRETAAHFRAS